MINQLLNLTRPLFIFDVEATSLDTQKARIVELAFQRWEACGMTKEWFSRLNPGIPIPMSATKVHGITDADVVDKPMFKQIAENLARGFSNCSFGGQNIRYDLKVLASEMSRAGVSWSYAGAQIIDSSRLEALAIPRDLSSLHKKYVGLPHDGAHGALSDVRASTTVIVKQLETHTMLPRDLTELHNLQWPGWIVADGSFVLINDVPTCAFGKWKNTPVKDIPRDYWDWLLSANFPDDVKQLARDAKMGKYNV